MIAKQILQRVQRIIFVEGHFFELLGEGKGREKGIGFQDHLLHQLVQFIHAYFLHLFIFPGEKLELLHA